MLDDIYNRKILELAANIPRLGRLAAPQASASAHSRLCGSSVTIDLALADGRVADFAQEVKACALGQVMRKMLKENGAPPQGRFADAGVLVSARDYKARHASILLVFDAVAEALDKIDKAVVQAHPPVLT